MKHLALVLGGALACGAALTAGTAQVRAADLYADDDAPLAVTRRFTVEREVPPPPILERRTYVERRIVQPPPRIVERRVIVERPIVVRPRPVIHEVIVRRPIIERDVLFEGRGPVEIYPREDGYGPDFDPYD